MPEPQLLDNGMSTQKVPEMMKAAIVEEHGKPLVMREDIPVPNPEGDGLLVRITATSLCSTDVTAAAGHLWPLAPFCPGHEPVGRIVAIGPDGSDQFQIGDRVGFMPTAKPCHKCKMCLARQHRYCDSVIYVGTGTMYGGFSEYSLCDPVSTVKIPDQIEDEVAAPLLCAGVTAYGAVRKVSTYQPNGTLINIIGVGGVGHLAVQYAKAMGYDVQAFDIVHEKLDLARKCGADIVVDSMDQTAVSDARRATCSIVISGAISAYNLAFEVTEKRGKVIAVGVPAKDVPVSMLRLIMTELSLITTFQGSRDELVEALDLAARRGIKPIYTREHITKLNDGIAAIMEGKIHGRTVYHW